MKGLVLDLNDPLRPIDLLGKTIAITEGTVMTEIDDVEAWSEAIARVFLEKMNRVNEIVIHVIETRMTPEEGAAVNHEDAIRTIAENDAEKIETKADAPGEVENASIATKMAKRTVDAEMIGGIEIIQRSHPEMGTLKETVTIGCLEIAKAESENDWTVNHQKAENLLKKGAVHRPVTGEDTLVLNEMICTVGGRETRIETSFRETGLHSEKAVVHLISCLPMRLIEPGIRTWVQTIPETGLVMIIEISVVTPTTGRDLEAPMDGGGKGCLMTGLHLTIAADQETVCRSTPGHGIAGGLLWMIGTGLETDRLLTSEEHLFIEFHTKKGIAFVDGTGPETCLPRTIAEVHQKDPETCLQWTIADVHRWTTETDQEIFFQWTIVVGRTLTIETGQEACLPWMIVDDQTNEIDQETYLRLIANDIVMDLQSRMAEGIVTVRPMDIPKTETGGEWAHLPTNAIVVENEGFLTIVPETGHRLATNEIDHVTGFQMIDQGTCPLMGKTTEIDRVTAFPLIPMIWIAPEGHHLVKIVEDMDPASTKMTGLAMDRTDHRFQMIVPMIWRGTQIERMETEEDRIGRILTDLIAALVVIILTSVAKRRRSDGGVAVEIVTRAHAERTETARRRLQAIMGQLIRMTIVDGMTGNVVRETTEANDERDIAIAVVISRVAHMLCTNEFYPQARRTMQ